MTDIAGTTHKASFTIEDICAAMKNRGRFDGSYEEAVETLCQFYTEMFAQPPAPSPLQAISCVA